MSKAPDPVQVRRFRAGDEAGVQGVILPIQTEEFGVPITFEDQPDLTDIPGFYQQGTGDFWVAEAAETVVGTISLLDIGNGEAALRKMFVAAPWRGRDKAVAQRLLDTLIAHARSRDLTAIYLGTTALFLAAHRFYEKNGFELIDIADLPGTFPRLQVDTRFYKLTL